jgi:hypothetical protein
MCEEYNGWKNRQTWLVNLWLNNKPSSQQALYDIANDAEELVDGSPAPIYMRADTLMEYIMDRFYMLESLQKEIDNPFNGLFLDLINVGIWSADLEAIVSGAVDNYVEAT